MGGHAAAPTFSRYGHCPINPQRDALRRLCAWATLTVDAMTTIDPRQLGSGTTARGGVASRVASRSHVKTYLPLLVATMCIAGVFVQSRWSLGSTLTMQCDELPLLTRFTGLCGRATNEAEAQAFTPGLFTLRTGAIRSFRVLKGLFAVHTTTGFWANLTIHLFGYSPAGVRAGPLFWSIVGLLAVGWGAWLVSGRLPAACVAVVVVVLSPFHVAYAAQARGYAEAMALTPLLLVFLTYFLRRPDSWIRAALVFVCAMQLSLTVYTMWVFWVLPVLTLAVWMLPRATDDPAQRRMVRTVTALVLVAMLCFMSVYTAVRYYALFSAATFGERFHTFSDAADWMIGVLQAFFTLPGVCVVFAIVGGRVLWKSDQHWWCWAIAAGCGAPLALAIANGSPGYMRNLSFLIPLAAILVGLGADVVLQAMRHRASDAVLGGVTAVVLLFVATTTHGSVTASATRILYPDWGGIVLRLDRLPETEGRRWLCPCLANHWQIDWYRKPNRDADLLDVAVGRTIEVVMGAQHENGKPVIYRSDPFRGGIRPGPLPDYLGRVRMAAFTRGVELRRWKATRVPLLGRREDDPDAPVFMAVYLSKKSTQEEWNSFLIEGGAYANGVVPFNLVPIPDGFLLTLIVRSGDAAATIDGLRQYVGVASDGMRRFSLTPLASKPALYGE